MCCYPYDCCRFLCHCSGAEWLYLHSLKKEMARSCADLKPDSTFLISEETKDGCLHLDHPLPGLQQTGLFSSGGCLGPSGTSSISFIFYCRRLVGLLRAPIYSVSPPALWPGARQGQPRSLLGTFFPDFTRSESTEGGEAFLPAQLLTLVYI